MAKSFFIDFLFPKRCVACQKWGFYICQDCQKEIRFLEHQFCYRCGRPSFLGFTHPFCRRTWDLDGVISSFYFLGSVKKAIHKLKYKFISDLAEELVEIAFSNALCLSAFGSIAVKREFNLLPVPLHPVRQKWRGFNQTEVLAKIIAKKFDLKMRKDILQRTINTKAQVDLPAEERQKNVQGAFSCFNKQFVRNKNFLLVDDMVTTGATLANCAQVLKRAGASSVWALTLARSQRIV